MAAKKINAKAHTAGPSLPAPEFDLLKELNKDGDDTPAEMLGSDLMAKKIRGVISTQCATLDRAIGRGGIPLGRLTLLHGKEGSGKTTLALHCIAETQARNGMVVYVDAECKLDPEYAEKVGVDPNRLIIVKPKYLEKFFGVVERTIASVARSRVDGRPFPALVVLDSVNALQTKAEFDGTWESQFISSVAGVYSAKLKKLMPMVSAEDIALLFISQEREKIGVLFGKKEQTGGGKAPRFYSSLIVEVSRQGAVLQGETIVGNETSVKCSKNQIAPPFRTAAFRILFDRGIDRDDALYREAIRSGVIVRAGAWYSYGELRWQGEERVREAIRNTEGLRGDLMKALEL